MESSLTTHRTTADFIGSLPGHQQHNAKAIHDAVYSASIGMTDEDVQAVVKDALLRARRALSS